jgi:cyanophycin synthetase
MILSQSIEPLKTGIVFGPTRYFSAPGVMFYLHIPTLADAEYEAIQRRISKVLRKIHLALDSPRHSFCPLNAQEFIGEQFGELVIMFQRAADAEVCHYAVVHEGEEDKVKVLVEKEDHGTAFYSGMLALQVLNAALSEAGPIELDMDDDIRSFLDFAAERMLDPNARLVLQAARRYRIPVFDLEQEPFAATRTNFTVRHGLLQLGLCARQHRFLGAMPHGEATKIRRWIYQREAMVRRLQEHGLPLPRQDLEFPNKNRYSRVLRAAQRIGFPVVLKLPVSSEFDDALPTSGVIGPVQNADQLAQAYECGFWPAHSIWIESYVPGATYRFLIMDSKLLSVVRLRAPSVVGDGIRSVRLLAEAKASSSGTLRDRVAWNQLLTHHFTACRMALNGSPLEFVPQPGASVMLDFDSVAFTGSGSEELAEKVPDEYRTLALHAAAACGLEYTGVDIVINDLSGPATYPNAVVVAIRPEPDLRIHAESNPELDVAGRLIREYFPTREDATVPIVAITGTNGKTTTSRMIASIFRQAGKCTGLACSDGVYADNELLEAGDLAGITGSLMLYARSEIEALVLETARGGLITLGRSFDVCDVGVCLNVAADHLGQDGVESVEEMAVVKRQVIENTLGAAVLNAEDPLCVGMASFSSAQLIILFSGKPGSVRIAQHISAGGKAVYVRYDGDDELFVYFDGATHTSIVEVKEVPATFDGKARHNVDNAAAAMAAAFGVGLPLTAIRSALRQFHMGFETTPSRLNELLGRPYRVLMDAAHNLHGLRALMAYIDSQSVPGKRIIVFGASSRFPEADVREMARLISTRFDRFICKKYRVSERFSTCSEPWQILCDELMNSGIRKEAIQIVLDPKEAVAVAIKEIEPGDLLLVLVPAGRSLESGIWEEILRLTGEKE